MSKEKNKYLHKITFILSVLGMMLLFYDFGFNHGRIDQEVINGYYLIILFIEIISILTRFITHIKIRTLKVLILDLVLIIVILSLLYIHIIHKKGHGLESLLYNDIWLKLSIILVFIREFAARNISFARQYINEIQLFILSFFGLILIGTFLLLLPNATIGHFSPIDALFTSTSAVCVTGLVVQDTGTFFTPFGQVIILTLIQLGGLGILTFVSYFSYFFKQGSSYENQIIIKQMTNTEKISEVFSVLKKIIITTFTIEIIGSLLIYFTTGKDMSKPIFFSVFHSVSAFCNAGFSTLSNSLYENSVRFNYNFQLIIILLFVLGGLGFPIVFNLLNLFKIKLRNTYYKLFNIKSPVYQPWILKLNSKITLITTLILIVIGTLSFLYIEYHGVLSEHSSYWGKFVTALFGATTPRTAGFNSFDMGALKHSTIVIIIFLMWIGASPASTGGGIKTSTFAIAFLNIFSMAKGKQHIEINRRMISDSSVRRAFAIITLSFLFIGFGTVLMYEFDSQLHIFNLAFESFSAYGTVGLSTGITSILSTPSKWVLIFLMFAGRVGMLSIFIAFFKKAKRQNYKYPTEEILIN